MLVCLLSRLIHTVGTCKLPPQALGAEQPASDSTEKHVHIILTELLWRNRQNRILWTVEEQCRQTYRLE